MTARELAAARAGAGPRVWPAVLLVVAAAAPFALNLAGDAQVHLAIAEAFADGRPFQYNPGGEIVVASTSPFWTMLLALYFRLAGSWAPALLSATAVLFWLAAGYVLYRVARDLWAFRGFALWAVMLLWLAHTTIVANALGGLENVASALQVLLLYWLLSDGPVTSDERRVTSDERRAANDERRTTNDELRPERGRAAAIGLVLGWALLTRPDGGLFALLLVALSLPLWAAGGGWRARRGCSASAHADATAGSGRPSAVGGLLLTTLFAALVLAPWFIYQYAETGRLLTDSSLARLYNGRLGSLALVPGLLYAHPKALLSLASAFLPLAAGFLVYAGALGLRFVRARGGRLALYRAHFPQVSAVLLVVGGFLFYTFVVGAESFGRYFLPLFPFLFLAGVGGLELGYQRLAAAGWRWPAVVLLALAALFLVATSALDTYRRLGPGRFAPESALDVIRGPAERRYYAANVPFLVAAPQRRAAMTDEFLRDLGAGGGPVSVAVTEVQLRYFLDDRVTVLSLDGRTSADILGYTDPASGVPDFGRYFNDARPDYVHVRQWCEVGGWLASVFPARIRDNLVCQWERRAAEMRVGDTFDWQGRTVTLVAPDMVRIDWGP